MSAFYNGVLLVELPEEERYDVRTGIVRIRRWQGTLLEIQPIKVQAIQDGYRYSTQTALPYTIISVEFPESEIDDPNEPLSDEWEVEKNLIQKSVWELAKVKAELTKIGVTNYPEIRASFKKDFDNLFTGNPTKGRKAKVDGSGNPTLGSDGQIEFETYTITLDILLDVARLYGANTDILLQLANSMSRGVTHFDVIQYVAKHTRYVNPKSNIKAVKENVLKMFTADAFVQIVPTSVKFELPTGGYYWKVPPKVDRSNRSKWKIEEEYWHVDEYEFFIYENPITTPPTQ